jgi:hypothetical protein
MSITKSIQNAERKAKERGWDKIFIAVDWHDTICESTYGGTALHFYPFAIKTLKSWTENPQIELILFTSSYQDNVKEFLEVCEAYGIHFEYINENPEVKNTAYGDFRKKFYYDLLIDDKAGFDQERDWHELWVGKIKWEIKDV